MRPIYTAPSFEKKTSSEANISKVEPRAPKLNNSLSDKKPKQPISQKSGLDIAPALTAKTKAPVLHTWEAKKIIHLAHEGKIEAVVQAMSSDAFKFLLKHPDHVADLALQLLTNSSEQHKAIYTVLKEISPLLSAPDLQNALDKQEILDVNIDQISERLVIKFLQFDDYEDLKKFIDRWDSDPLAPFNLSQFTTEYIHFNILNASDIIDGSDLIFILKKLIENKIYSPSVEELPLILSLKVELGEPDEQNLVEAIKTLSLACRDLYRLAVVLAYGKALNAVAGPPLEALKELLLRPFPPKDTDTAENPLALEQALDVVFQYIQQSGAEGLWDTRFLIESFNRNSFSIQGVQYYTALINKLSEYLGAEKFLEYAEASLIFAHLSIYEGSDAALNPYKKQLLAAFVEKGLNPMQKVTLKEIDTKINGESYAFFENTDPNYAVAYPILSRSFDLATQRCLAQSQHPEYKAFVLASMFGLRSARLAGSNPAATAPIIEKGFDAFIKAFPSTLDAAILDRIREAYGQSIMFTNRQDLLKHFVESPANSDTIQLAYLNADEHAYAYLIYQDMLIETQRSTYSNVLQNDDGELFYLTNATTFDGQKVHAIQMLPIDKAEAQKLLEPNLFRGYHPRYMQDYHLRFGKDTLGFCQRQGRVLEDLTPLLEHLGLETSFSTITDPLQQKKVALGEIFQNLGYLETDGSGATLDALKDQDSFELAESLCKNSPLDANTLASWLEDSSLNKIDFLKKVLDALGINQKKCYYVSDADRKDPLAALAFEKTPQKTGNCYFASPMLNFGALIWWATALERAKTEGIVVTREHVGQNPEFYKAIYAEIEPVYKELVKSMKLKAWEDYQQRFGKLPSSEMQAELEAKVAKLRSSSYTDVDDDAI